MRPTDFPTASRFAFLPSLDRRGFTIIEVMAAIAIFGIMIAAAFATFLSQRQSYVTQNRVAEMQQNLRVATDMLLRDIRMAGYGIHSDVNVPLSAVGGTGTTVAIRGLYDTDGGTSNSDGIYILYTYDMDNTVPALQPTLTTGAVTADNLTSPLTVNVTPGTGTRFSPGNLVVLGNGSTSDMYEVASRDNNSLTFGSSSLYNSTGHAGNSYDVGSQVSLARFVRYSVDTTDPTHPTLMLQRMPGTSSQPVAEDLEDIQFLYGLASTANSTLVNTTVDSPSDAQLSLIRRVNVSLIARSHFPETGWQGSRQNLGNRTGSTSTDGYRRRVLDNVAVEIRNVRLN